MLDYLLQYGLFLAEITTVVIAIGVVIRFLFNAIRHAREYTAEHLEVKNLNRRFEQMADVLNHDLLNPHERKAHIKAKKKNTSSVRRSRRRARLRAHAYSCWTSIRLPRMLKSRPVRIAAPFARGAIRAL